MDTENVISDGAEAALRLIVEDFAIELANQGIGARHACRFEASAEASLAMVRLAYLRGRTDADKPIRIAEVRALADAMGGVNVGPEPSAPILAVVAILTRRLDELQADGFEADLARMQHANARHENPSARAAGDDATLGTRRAMW